MNFIKKNIVFVGMLLVFVVLLAGSLFLLMNQINESRALFEERREKTDSIRSYLGNTPYPNQENVLAIQKNVKQEDELTDEAIKVLTQNTSLPAFDRITGTRASTYQQNRVDEMKKLLSSRNVRFAADFKFGFDRYYKKETSVPKDEDTPKLLRQMYAIEELVKLACAAKITELVSIRRVEFEETRGQKGTTFNASTVSLISANGEFSIVDKAEATGFPYTVMPFEIVFTGDTDALRSFLNGLAQAKIVLIPRIMNIENNKTTPMIVRAQVAAIAAANASGKPAPTGAVGAATQPVMNLPAGVKAPSADLAYIDPETLPFVMGDDLLTVGMRVEWFEFRTDEIKGKPKEKAKNQPKDQNKDQPKDQDKSKERSAP